MFSVSQCRLVIVMFWNRGLVDELKQSTLDQDFRQYLFKEGSRWDISYQYREVVSRYIICSWWTSLGETGRYNRRCSEAAVDQSQWVKLSFFVIGLSTSGLFWSYVWRNRAQHFHARRFRCLFGWFSQHFYARRFRCLFGLFSQRDFAVYSDRFERHNLCFHRVRSLVHLWEHGGVPESFVPQRSIMHQVGNESSKERTLWGWSQCFLARTVSSGDRGVHIGSWGINCFKE